MIKLNSFFVSPNNYLGGHKTSALGPTFPDALTIFPFDWPRAQEGLMAFNESMKISLAGSYFLGTPEDRLTAASSGAHAPIFKLAPRLCQSLSLSDRLPAVRAVTRLEREGPAAIPTQLGPDLVPGPNSAHHLLNV